MSPNNSEISAPVEYEPPAAPWSLPNGSQVTPIHPHFAGQSILHGSLPSALFKSDLPGLPSCSQ